MGCSVFLQALVKMAEGSRDQGGIGTTDPEEDSPNMIVYRKARLTLCVCYCILSTVYDVRSICREAMTHIQAPDSAAVHIGVYTTHCFLSQVSGSLSFNHLKTDSTPFLFLPSELFSSHCVHHLTGTQFFNKLPIPLVEILDSERSFWCQG